MTASITRPLGHLIVALAAGSVSPVADGGTPHVVQADALVPMAAEPLRPLYRLDVVAVPEPPAHIAAAASRAPGCPVEVRAIVQGDESTFAMLAFGSSSELVHVGEGVRTREGWVAVTAIEADHVVLRHGETTHRCALGQEP